MSSALSSAPSALPVPADATFADLGLPPALEAAIADLGFTIPSAIQAQAVPALLSGRDIVGVAQTGTGKTAAFGLPLLAAIDYDLAGRPGRRPDPDARARDAGGRRHPVVRDAPARPERARGVRRLAVPAAAARAVPRRAGRRRHPRPRARPPRPPHAEDGPGPLPRARRGRRDAAHGLRRGRRQGPLRRAPRASGRPVLRHDAAADPPRRRAAPQPPGRDHGLAPGVHRDERPPDVRRRPAPPQDRRARPRARRVRRPTPPSCSSAPAVRPRRSAAR